MFKFNTFMANFLHVSTPVPNLFHEVKASPNALIITATGPQ